MKLNENFVLRRVADVWVAIPVGMLSAEYQGMLNLNETGALLWQGLEQGKDRGGLIALLTDAYEVTEQQAGLGVDAFLQKLSACGCLEE